jgi:hypothetical protein
VQHQGYADAEAEYGDGYYEDEEPRRGKRWILIAVALVGAIGVGGVLAYTYRSLVAKSRLEAVKTDPNAKLRADRRPVQVKLADEAPPPTRIGVPEPPPADEPPGASGDSQGPRSVKVIPILPGAGAQPAAAGASPAAVPGISIYTPPGGSAPPPAQAREVQAPPGGRVTLGTKPAPPPVQAPPVQAPPVQAPPVQAPPVQAPRVAVAEEEAPVVAASPPAKTRKPPAQQIAGLGAPKPPAPPPVPREPSAGGQGFVAVLKSEKSQIDAMKTFADMQQRYPDVLGDKSFDVQEADLSSRNLGTMYRVVVGPPSSHNAATGICSQLKAAGYAGCWVKEW